MWWSVPVSSMAREGEQAAAAWKSVKRRPCVASCEGEG